MIRKAKIQTYHPVTGATVLCAKRSHNEFLQSLLNFSVILRTCYSDIRHKLFINPRRACAARVTVVVLCVCMYVCVYVCMYVCMCVCVCVFPLIPAASHIGITKKRYQRIHRNTGIV